MLKLKISIFSRVWEKKYRRAGQTREDCVFAPEYEKSLNVFDKIEVEDQNFSIEDSVHNFSLANALVQWLRHRARLCAALRCLLLILSRLLYLFCLCPAYLFCLPGVKVEEDKYKYAIVHFKGKSKQAILKNRLSLGLY